MQRFYSSFFVYIIIRVLFLQEYSKALGYTKVYSNNNNIYIKDLTLLLYLLYASLLYLCPKVLLQVEPGNRQVQMLKAAIEKRMERGEKTSPLYSFLQLLVILYSFFS